MRGGTEGVPAVVSPVLRSMLVRASREARTSLTSPLSRPARVALVALSLTLLFGVAVQSSSDGHESALFEEAARRGADRLVALQTREGTWPLALGSAGDPRRSGIAGEALLMAHRLTRDPRHLAAAERAGRALLAEVEAGRASGGSNLQFLAELGRATERPALVEAARRAWLRTYQSDDAGDAAEAARQLLTMENYSDWSDGAWGNYLLVRAAEEGRAARALGYHAWADAYLLQAASMWAPKHDHDFWASAAGSMLEALSACADPRAVRFRFAHSGLLEVNEIESGLSWNDTPYDTYLHAQETAAALEGRLMHERASRPRKSTVAGLAFVASRQAAHGGWGATLSLLDDVARRGDGDLAPADAAAEETPETNALLVRTMVRAALHAPRG